jgi:hypothetical protein
MEKAHDLIQKYLSFEAILPTFDFQSVATAFSAKGVGGMESFEKQVLALFDDVGLDIRTKTMAEASMPLYIVASNLTDGVPSLFSDKIPVLDAVKASCCFPGAFRPYELYGKAYIDGDILLPSISCIVPKIEEDTLILVLPKRRQCILTPRRIETMSPVDYVSEIHTLRMRAGQMFHNNSQTVSLSYPKLESSSDLSQMDISNILLSAGTQLRVFLGTQ